MRRVLCSFCKIKLVDRCLILLMALLMLQSAYNLFVNERHSQDTTTIDVMVRTTSAAIFGYFMSANFIHLPRQPGDQGGIGGAEPREQSASSAGGAVMRGKIGFAGEAETAACPVCPPPDEETERARREDQQTIIVTIVGVTAFCILAAVRNFADITPAMLGTISQLRDFVSGCVGFLLGTPGRERTKTA